MTLEDAETLIRRVVKDEFFKQTPAPAIGRKVDAVIDDALKSITLPVLRDAAVRSLRAFAQRQYNAYKRAFGTSVLLVAAMATYTNNKAPAADRRRATQTIAEYSDFNLSGSPMKKYVRDYMRDNVRPALDRIARLEAKDPDDVSGRNSLRNRAEMEVRYRAHADNIEDLRAAGHKLVIASTHADCSKRCRSWQGRVYSLDGTSGITDDGRRYVPLETATDVYYTTRAGKTYKNGLLGFNCRHYLVPYKSGYRFPKPNPAEERRQYAITQRQRALERNVRYWRTKAVTSQGIDRARYAEAKAKATAWNERYIAFSQANRRAYYPSRTTII